MTMAPCILIVDDEPRVAFLLQQALRMMRPECVVLIARSGAEALALAGDRGLDAAIVDYRLKEMDGLTLVARLRQRHPKLQVVMITAGTVPDADGAYGEEDFHWIQKPFSIARLISLLDEVLHHPHPNVDSGDAGDRGASTPSPESPIPPAGPGDGESLGRGSHPQGPNIRKP